MPRTDATHAERNRRYYATAKGRETHRQNVRAWRRRQREENIVLKAQLAQIRAAMLCPGCYCLVRFGKPCEGCWKNITNAVGPA